MKAIDIDLNKVPAFAGTLRGVSEKLLAVHAKVDLSDALKEKQCADILNAAFP